MVSISYWRVCGLQLLLFHVIFTQMYTLDVILLFYTMLASQESAFLYQYELLLTKVGIILLNVLRMDNAKLVFLD